MNEQHIRRIRHPSIHPSMPGPSRFPFECLYFLFMYLPNAPQNFLAKDKTLKKFLRFSRSAVPLSPFLLYPVSFSLLSRSLLSLLFLPFFLFLVSHTSAIFSEIHIPKIVVGNSEPVSRKSWARKLKITNAEMGNPSSNHQQTNQNAFRHAHLGETEQRANHDEHPGIGQQTDQVAAQICERNELAESLEGE